MMRSLYVLCCGLLAACSGADIDLGHGANGSGGALPDAAGITVPPVVDGGAASHLSAVLFRAGDLPQPGSVSSSATTSGAGTTGSAAASSTTGPTGGTNVDPDKRFLFIGNGPPTCVDPFAGSDCGFFRVTIHIPSSLFVPGVYSLGDQRIVSTFSSRGPVSEAGTCSGDGGPFSEGTFEIVDISSMVLVRITGTAKLGFDVDGTYEVPQCP